MSDSETDYLQEAEGESIDDGIMRAILAPILAIGGGAALLVEAGFQGIANLFNVFDDIRRFIGALFLEPIVALEMGAQATGVSAQEFGLLAFPLAAASVAGSLLIVDAMWGNDIPLVSAINPLS